MKKKLGRGALLASTLVLLAGLVLAANYVFSVPEPWDDIDAVNEANVQRRAGALNVAKRVNDTVTANFGDNRHGTFIRVLLISSHAFRQTGGPFDGSGGSCQIRIPMITAIYDDGSLAELGSGIADPLTELGTDDDGTPLVLDQFAMTAAVNGILVHSNATNGFVDLRQSPAVLDAVLKSSDAQSSTTRRRQGSAPSARVLPIQHQGAHPANHNFTPTPEVTFTQQSIRAPAGSTRQGWAVLAFGRSGKIHDVRVLPSDGGEATPELAAGLKSAVRTTFQDERRHPHTVYVAFRHSGSSLILKGPGIVTLPKCCGIPCPPPPPGQWPEPC